MPKTSRLWIPELDGLRAVAALSVIVHHATGSLLAFTSLANTAVSLFFVLSGFLIYVLAANEFARTGTLNIRGFYARRVFRIWPLYFVTIIGCLLIFGNPSPLPDHPMLRVLPESQSTWQYLVHSAWPFFVFVSNWAMALNFQGPLYWWAPDVLSVTWSISVEEQYYLFFPLVFLPLAWGRVRASAVLAALLIASLVLRYVLIVLPVNYHEPEKIGSSTGLYYATFSYVDMFVAGGVAGWLYLRRQGRESALTMTALLLLAAIGSALLMLAWPAGIWVPYRWYSPLIYSGLAVTLAALVYACVACPGSPQSFILRQYPLRVLGLLSYGMYLVHFPSIRVALWWFAGRQISPWVMVAFAVLLAVAIAALLHGTVERPFLLLRHRARPSGLSSTSVPWRLTLLLALSALLLLMVSV